MNGKTLNFDEVKINKKKFHGSRQTIVLDLVVDINKIVTSAKLKHGDKSFKYFISYADNDIIIAIASNKQNYKIF